jgi:outer membrane protein assembly factor BamE (lipoprotein component of BamABCDE complex)
MKKSFAFVLLVAALFAACSKSTVTPVDNTGANIVSIDSSEFNGRLYVNTFDYVSGNRITNANVYLYTNYEDIQRNLYLLFQKTNTAGEADFGYLLQGNYYIVSESNFKRDTSLVQILSKRTIVRNVYLQ